MAVKKLQVFLASAFEEFSELRRELATRINRRRSPPVEAIDLNDNAPDSRPPLDRCFEGVDRAEIVVVLVGERYGASSAPGMPKESYTHLEYRRAVENRSKIILPFVIDGRDPRSTEVHDVRDEHLRRWIVEIEANQCISRLDSRLSPTELASEIYEAVAERIFEAFTDTVGVPGADDEEDEDAAPAFAEDAPIKRSELAEAPKLRPEPRSREQPLRTAAAEHAREALEALEVGLPLVAIHHLRKAVDLIPLDIVLSYWLARLLIATGGVAECKEGRQHAQRCARVAERTPDAPDLAGMGALVLAARANERLRDPEAALAAARAAYDAASHHWLAKLELGRQCALSGLDDEAMKYANEAFWVRPDCILRIRRDSAYSTLGPRVERLWEELRESVAREEKRIVDLERSCEWLVEQVGRSTAVTLVAAPEPPAGEKGPRLGILALVRACRLSTVQITSPRSPRVVAQGPAADAELRLRGIRG